MASAVHLICKPNATGDLERLSRLDDGRFRTCCWALSARDAAGLEGGWLYLHETKGEPSRFGGQVVVAEPFRSDEFAREDRFAFIFAPHRCARGVKWRGRSHAMAWTGGLVDAALPHERA